MDLKGKKIAVLGLGEDGASILQGLAKVGAQVEGFGTLSPSILGKTEENLKRLGCKLHGDAIAEAGLLAFDLIVDTPGSGVYERAKDVALERGIPVYNDLDLVTHFISKPIIAVTGTNGKSTTVKLIDEMLKKQGYKVLVAGGDFERWDRFFPDRKNYDYCLLELSSKRLEKSFAFHPHVAVLLNIFPAHEERHPGGMPEYLAAKAKIFQRQTEQDYLIYEGSAGNIRELLNRENPPAKRVPFSLEGGPNFPGVHKEKKHLVWVNETQEREVYSLDKAKSKGPTFILNAMAALAVARICGVHAKHIQPVLDEFKGLASRLENVRTLGKVRYYDDSRATNIGASVWALSSFASPIIWIAGGALLKEENLGQLIRAVKGRVKQAIVIGVDKKKFAKNFAKSFPTSEAENLQEAVLLAHQIAEANDVVLFSPASPPDILMQSSEISPGSEFQKWVMQLPEPLEKVRPRADLSRI